MDEFIQRTDDQSKIEELKSIDFSTFKKETLSLINFLDENELILYSELVKLKQSLISKKLYLDIQFVVNQKDCNDVTWWHTNRLLLAKDSDKEKQEKLIYIKPDWDKFIDYKKTVVFIFSNEERKILEKIEVNIDDNDKYFSKGSNKELQDLKIYFENKSTSISNYLNYEDNSIEPIKNTLLKNKQIKWIKLDQNFISQICNTEDKIFEIFACPCSEEFLFQIHVKKLENFINLNNLKVAIHFIATENNRDKVWWPGPTFELKLKEDKEEKKCCYYIDPKWQEFISAEKRIRYLILNDKNDLIGDFIFEKDHLTKFNLIGKSGPLLDIDISFKMINNNYYEILEDISKNNYAPIYELFINKKLSIINELLYPTKFFEYWDTDQSNILEYNSNENKIDLVKDKLLKKILNEEKIIAVPEYTNRLRIESHVAKHEKEDKGKGFRYRGLNKFHFIYNTYKRFSHKKFEESTVLDWGCGCGSISRYSVLGCKKLYGLDVDPINIDWCNKNIAYESTFKVVEFFDELNFLEDNSIDLIYAFSVMTHLIPEHQDYWLKVLAKKCRGFLILSFHGSSYEQNRSSNPDDVIDRITNLTLENEMRTFKPNLDINDVDEDGVYTDVSNSYKDITLRWSKYVDILSIQHSGHDWAICRPKLY